MQQVGPLLRTSTYCRMTSLKYKRTLVKLIFLHSCCSGDLGNSVSSLPLKKIICRDTRV